MVEERGVSETRPVELPVELLEDQVPLDGIEEAFAELVDLYGGEITASRDREREFALPLRRGVASAGAVACTLSWSAAGEVRLRCDRDVDAPKFQRILLLVAGVAGSLLFMIWPFFPHETAYGTLAALGGVMAIAVYLMTLRKTSGGIASDFLQRLVRRQRTGGTADPAA
jgi:hypothetical protein